MKLVSKLALTLAVLISNTAYAATLTYEFDFEKQPDISRETIEDLCGLPLTMTFDDKQDIPQLVTLKTQHADPKTAKIQWIEKSVGGISGGDLKEPYQGDYVRRVAIVRLPGDGGYKEGIYNRVEVTTYGSAKAPKAFEVESDLLNYRQSAELAEASACSRLAYKRK